MKDYYFNLAFAVAERSTCLRRKYGAVLVKDGKVIATGYNGAEESEVGCNETGECAREILRTKKGEAYNVCRGIHSEMRALISAGERAKDATLYLASIDVKTGKTFKSLPCELCARLLKFSQIKEVVCHKGDI